MSMATVNLLPAESRRELAGEIMRRLAVFYGTLLLVIAGLLAVELMAIRLALTIEERSLREGGAFRRELEEFRSLTREASDTAGLLRTAEAFLLRTPPAAAFLEEILGLVPEEMTVSKIDFRRGEKTFALAGRAETRQILLAFESALKDLGSVARVELPLASLVKPRDLDFVMTIYAR